MTEKKSIENLFAEQNRLLREQNELLRQSNNIQAAPRPKKPWVCGSWPNCYHGRIVGGIFGCAGSR